MAKNLFSVPIFLIVFRETLEASIVVSVLLGLVEQIVHSTTPPTTATSATATAVAKDLPVVEKDGTAPVSENQSDKNSDSTSFPTTSRRLIKKLRWQIFLGSLAGFLIALAIGGAFIAVWFTKAANLWERSEELWEGVFSLLASVIIFIMGITMLKMDRAKARWKVKLQRAFEGKAVDGRTRTGKYALFFLPFITILREGMEGVIFVGGVSLGQPATSIPIATITGILCGIAIGAIIYTFASRTSITIFMIIMTNFILLIGAGLFSKTVLHFEDHAFKKLLGAHGDDSGAGDGPGTYNVRGNVWHLNCCNPDHSQGWKVFWAILGWTNSASVGSILAYVAYWIAVVIAVIMLKFREGDTKFCGWESRRGRTTREQKEAENHGVV